MSLRRFKLLWTSPVGAAERRERKLETGLVKLFPPSGPSAGCDLNEVIGQVHTRGEETQHQLQASGLSAAGPAGPAAPLERKILCTCEEKVCASNTSELRMWVRSENNLTVSGGN